MSLFFRRAFVVAASAAAALASFSVASASLDGLPTAPRPVVHVMPTFPRSHGRSPATSEPITYHGGAVMTGPVHVYAIWYGTWSSRSRRRTIVRDFLRHLDSPYWNINRTFPNASGRTVDPAPSFAGEIDDPGSSGVSQMSDLQIQAVVERAVSTKALPRDSNGVYLVLTSSKVTKTGFLTEYCGWHSAARIQGSTLKFSFVGDPSGPKVRNCSPQGTSPNGDVGADAMVSTIAHELDETVTDPTMRGWRTAHGEENADRCAWKYGTVYTSGGGHANMQLGGRHYLVQTNWVNGAAPHCGLTATPPRVVRRSLAQ
jgi:hypothetical protein